MLPSVVPQLVSSLVILRAFEPRDATLIASVANDPLIPLISTVPTSGEAADVDAYLQRQHERLTTGTGYSFAITDSRTHQGVGQIGLWTGDIATGRASTGYWIAPQFRRRGYAAAALQMVTEWAFTLDAVRRLHLFVEPWNEGSWRAAEACGYQREGLLRAWEQVGQERRDMYAYSVISGVRATH